ncbi:type IV conjugative transfer system lipoprotein TraV [Yersinia enterocolitica]|nr:type IV conjugative transfer system protein TraV [Yersinia enterocolitica]ELI7924483.1 type IV conjugative transfer system lipoprotein TraV [Yersinia enterocolitica]
MKTMLLPVITGAFLLSGCAGVKSSFDCDATTSDTCMTMTKANQLAREKVQKQAGKPAVGELPSLVNLPAPSMSATPQATIAPRSTSTDKVKTIMPTPASAPANARPLFSGTSSRTVSQPPSSSCQTVRCDSPGIVTPQRVPDEVATLWIAPWVDSDQVFHQPGRVSFVVRAADWALPTRIH